MCLTQLWIFAMRYLESAIACSQTPIMTLETKKRLLYSVLAVYSAIVIGMYLYISISFPGYDYYNDSPVAYF